MRGQNNHFQHHTNDLRSEKQRIRQQLEREIQQRKVAEKQQQRTYTNIPVESTKPNKPKRTRPRVMEVSGLSGHRTEQEPKSLQEGFTGLGKILDETPSYHFQNKFFKPGVLQEQVSKDRTDEFRKFIDQQRAEEDLQRKIAVSEDDLLKTNAFNPASKKFLESPAAQANTNETHFTKPYENTRYNKVRKTVVNIDSSHRDTSRYPNPNNYKIELPRSYQHVKEVKLVSTEIPNTDQVVRDDPPEVKRAKNRRKFDCGELLNDANNNLYWILAEDADQDYDCLIYNAKLTPGNYVALACQCDEVPIQDEIERQVAQVNHFDDGTPTQFLVDIDTRTNIVSITSIESVTLEVDPLSTTSGTNIIAVSQTAHGFSVNDTVVILGATSVGGIPAAQINTTHSVESVIDENTFEIRVNTIAATTTSGGGSNVTSGIEKPFKLLFSNLDTIGTILGFPQQDSSDSLARFIDFIVDNPDDLMGNPTIPGELPAQIQTKNHGLVPGDTILIDDTVTIPDINGIQTVTKIITPDLFEIGIPIKVVNNQTTTVSTRIGKIKQSLDDALTVVTRVDAQIFGNIQLGNAHGYALGDSIFIANVVDGILVGGNTLNGLHTVETIPNNFSFGVEENIEYEGNFGNAFVFKTNSTEVIPITGIIPQNNGVFTPFPVEPIFSGSDVPDYVLLRDFSITPDLNVDVDVDVDGIFQCGNTTTTTFATQSFTTSCTCEKKLLNIWIRVGNPSGVNVTASLELINEDTATSLGTTPLKNILNEAAVGTNFDISGTLEIFMEPGTTYRWEMTVFNGTVDICGNQGDLLSGGSSDLLDPDHDYEFRTYVSADIQDVSYYSISTGRFDLRNRIQDVSLQILSQNYIRSLDEKLRFINDAIVASDGIYRYITEHNQNSGQNFYVRRLTTPYRTTEPIVVPSIIGVQTIDDKISNFQFDTLLPIAFSTFASSSLLNNLATIRTEDETATFIQNIYPQSNGYLGKERNTCDPSRQQCILCPGDLIYVRDSRLSDCGDDGMLSQDFEGCYTINQIFSDVSPICDDIFDTANIIKEETMVGNLGECARLDTFKGVNGYNGVFNLATIFFEPFTETSTGQPQIWVVDLSQTMSGIGLWVSGGTSSTTFFTDNIQNRWFSMQIASAGNVAIVFDTGVAGSPTPGDVQNVINVTPSSYWSIQDLANAIDADLDGAIWDTSSPFTGYDAGTNTYTFVSLANGAPSGMNSVGNILATLNQITSGQDGEDPVSRTVTTAAALCIRTETPHLLETGDAIYYTITAPNCELSAANTLPLFSNLGDTVQFVVPDETDATVFKIFGTGYVSSSNPDEGIRNLQFYYHKICGSSFTPIKKFFPNTYCGMIESLSHDVQEDGNIYIGQTTVVPDINGYVDQSLTEVIDNNFLAWLGNCIVVGNVGSTFAGEFVNPYGNASTELFPADITAQNDGVIVADNNFLGGELVYFTNDTNINVDTSSELRNGIFTVGTDNLTSEQFSLLGIPIVSLGPLIGNSVQNTVVVTETTPGVYMMAVPSGTNNIDIEILGAGGGRGGINSFGGTGGRIVASYVVEIGGDIEPGDILEYTVGSKGGNGGGVAGVGGAFGAGGDAGTVASPPGFGGGGGGYSRLRNVTQGLTLAIAGGGGGGGGYRTGPITPDAGDGTGTSPGGDGEPSTLGGNDYGRGGTNIAGGMGGIAASVNATNGMDGASLTGGDGGGGNPIPPDPFKGSSGGGGGGGYFGGGGGGGRASGGTLAAGGAGGGSGFLSVGAIAQNRDSNGSPENTDGSVTLTFRQNIIGFGAGHFVQIPTDEESHGIITVDPNTNATFISSQNTGFPAPPNSTTILLTDNSFGDTDIAVIKDKITEASAFKTPAPSYSLTEFVTDIIVTDEDIDLGTGILQNNKVDVVSTDDSRFPGLNGLGWVLVNGNIEPIVNIIRDSTGKIFPVQSDLSVGDLVHFVSDHPTVPDMNGTFTVRYIDLGNIVPQFFELSDLTIINNGGPLANANTSIVYFRTKITGNTPDGCITINDISNSCPTIIRATAHGFPIGSNINVAILATDTDPPIDIGNAGIIIDATVLSEDLISLPKFDENLQGNLINLCNLDVINRTNLFITERGTWSREILSTNCGVPIFETDIANSQTIVITNSRRNLKSRLALQIANSNPETLGSTTITVILPPEYPEIPLRNGQEVIISGHKNANPTVDGTFKVFQVGTNSFRISINTIASSTGGTGGYATIPAPPTIPGHGLRTGYKVMFEHVKSDPDINNQVFEVTVLDENRFAIPVLLNSVNNKCPGQWCTNMVNLELIDHGFADGDLFFLYGAERFAGFQLDDINTIHGNKRQNVLTPEEKLTRKFATVIDANNIQFEALSFPYNRVLGGGYDICISAHNHDFAEQALGFKNYGFSSVQTNTTCNGELNSFIDLEPEPYIFMTSEKLTNILNTDTQVDDIFAKIQLSASPGEVLYDTFVTSPKIYDNPDKVLDEIDIQFVRRDGTPFNFLGMNHSFSLEITEYQDRILGTNIQSGRGTMDRGPVSQQGFVESTISGFHPQQNLLSPAQMQQATNLTQRINQP